MYVVGRENSLRISVKKKIQRQCKARAEVKASLGYYLKIIRTSISSHRLTNSVNDTHFSRRGLIESTISELMK